MRVAHVSIGALPAAFTSWGGAIQRRVAELARAQASLGHEVTVFSPAEQTTVTMVDGIEVHYLRCRARGPIKHLEYQARIVDRLMRARRRPDLIHFHSEPEGAVLAAPLRIPCLLSFDNFYFRRGRASRLFPVYKGALRRFASLLPVSRYCAQAATAYWQLPGDRVRVVYNGINFSQFRPDPVRARKERERLSVDGPMLLYLGRVCAQKGTDTLLDAFQAVRQSVAQVQLVVAGPEEQFSGRPRSSYGWASRIAAAGGRYIGQVGDERLAGLLSAADIFVMPTRELEMLGMAALEAQACGTPVVASDHGGLREAVPDHVGLRFHPGDASGLAASLVSLLENDHKREQLAARASAHASRFGWDKIALELDEIYQSALDRGHPDR